MFGITRNRDFGIKLFNEWMVDVIGAIIPGFLCITVLFVSVVVPCLIYCKINDKVTISFALESGFWWVFLIVCLILAYVIGHVFYRADITRPDKLNVQARINKLVSELSKEKYDTAHIKKLLIQEIETLSLHSEKLIEDDYWKHHLPKLQKACIHVIRELLDSDKEIEYDWTKEDEWIEDVLTILFPEETKPDKQLYYNSLSSDAQDVINEYRKYFSIEDEYDLERKFLLAFYCILHNQMDIGCATAKRCEFPYTNYYKYLIKRNLTHLARYAQWFNVEDRSKNKINSLKIQIQIFANEAYALVNKNESHIRMSSSTWHISKVLLFVTAICSVVFLSLLVDSINNSSCRCCQEYITIKILAAVLPIGMFLFVLYIRKCITRYIHYQRMREIQYTLQIYSQTKDIIEFRQKYYATEGYYQTNQCCHNKTKQCSQNS